MIEVMPISSQAISSRREGLRSCCGDGGVDSAIGSNGGTSP